jgi:hypothetical protein
MSDAPETIWRWAVQNCGGFIEYSDFPVISEHSTKYTRTDIPQAHTNKLYEQALAFRESIRKAALDSEHGHEILDLCWDVHFPEMPVNGVHSANLKANLKETP